MFPYLCLLSLSLFSIGYCEICGYRRFRKLLFWTLFVYAVLLAGLRYRVGGDTIAYMDSYAEIPEWSTLGFADFFYQMMEPGYLLLCVSVRSITHEFFVLQLIHAFIVNLAVFRFVRRYSSYPFVALFIYFLWYYFLFSFEFLRESLAVSVSLIAYPYYESRQWKKYYAWCLVALLCHMSAIITFVFPLLRHLRFNRRFACYLLVSCIAFGILKTVFLKGISLFPYLDGKIWYYLHIKMPVPWIILQLLPVAIAPFIGLWYVHRIRQYSRFDHLLCTRILLGLGICFIPHVFYRFANYTVLPFVLLLAEIVGSGLQRRVRINRFIASAACLFCTIMLFFQIYVAPIAIGTRAYEKYIPYYSVLNPVMYQPREKVLAERDFYSNQAIEDDEQ